MLIYTAFSGGMRVSVPSLGLTVFCVGLVWAFFATMDAVSYTWSDMSHWMRYIKALLHDGCFPTAETYPEITHSSYPPGSALFIAYAIPALPMTYLSGKAIFAMKMLHFACLSALLSPLELLPEKRRKAWYVCAGLITLMILGLLPYTYTVMTDLLLGLLAAAAVGMILYGMEMGKIPFFSVLAVLCCLCLVKQSGIVFVSAAVLFFVMGQRYLRIKAAVRIPQTILLLVIPLVLFSGWVLFSRMAYPVTETSKHTLSLTRFIGILSSHEIVFYKKLLRLYAQRFFSMNGKELVVFWSFLFSAGGLLLLCRKRIPSNQRKKLCKIYALMCICDGIYVLSVLFGYMFSFTEKEAMVLASFPRYFGSMVVVHIAVMGWLCLRILGYLPETAQKWSVRGFAAAAAALVLFNHMYIFLWQGLETDEFFRNKNEPDEWYIRQLCSAVEEHTCKNPEEQYILWLIDRTGEPVIAESYDVTMYCRIALSSYFCVDMEQVRVLDLTQNEAKDVEFVLSSFMNRDHALVVLTDHRPEAKQAAYKLNIPVLAPPDHAS